MQTPAIVRRAAAPRLLFSVLLAWVIAAPLPAAVVDSTWDQSTGNWFDPTRWSPAGVVPNNNATDQYRVTFGGGEATLTQNTTIDRLTFSGGTIGGAFDLTILDGLLATNATFTGAGTTRLQGSSTLSLFGLFLDAERTVRNEGALTWSSGQINLNVSPTAGTGAIVNAAGATFTAASDSFLTLNSSNQAGDSGASGHFDNLGTFAKTGTGTATINSLFHNTGTVNVQGGTLSLDGGGTHTGAFTGAATLEFGGGTHVVGAGASIATTNVTFSSETVTVDGAYNVAGTTTVSGGTAVFNNAATTANFTQSSGTVAGPGDLVVTGTAAITNGTHTGAGTTRLQGSSSINTFGLFLDAERTVRNEGALTWSSGQINLNVSPTAGTGAIVNAAGATFTAASDSFLTLNSSNQAGDNGASGHFDNLGTFAKTGTGTATINSLFHNSGTVNVQGGTLSLDGGGTHTGAFTGAATLEFGGGAHAVGAGASIATANVTFSSETTTVDGAYNVAGTTAVSGGTAVFNTAATTANFTQSSGTVAGPGNLVVTGTAAITNGTHTGAGTTVLQGTSSINTFGLFLDAERTVRNEGALTWSSGQINLNVSPTAGTGAIVNAAGGTFTASTNSFLTLNSSNQAGDSGVTGHFDNLGPFAKTGTGTATINSLFHNSGTVNVQGGTLSLDGGGTHTGSFTGAATLEFGGGTHAVGAGASITTANVTFSSDTATIDGTYNVAGTTAVSGGTAVFNTAATTANFTQSSGTVAGPGNLVVTGTAAITNGTHTGAGTTVLQGTSSINTFGLFLDAGRTVRNEGALTWSSGQINLNVSPTAGTGTIVNAAGGTFTASTNSFLTINSSNQAGDSGTTGHVDNFGTFVKAGTGTATINPRFDNPGTVDVQAGILDLAGTVTQHSGTTLTGGTWIVRNAGTLNLTVAGAQNITTNLGDVTLRGTGSSFARINSLVNNGGAFRLLDGRNFTATGAFTNSGTLQLGGGTFGAPSLTNAAGGEIFGFGTVSLRPTNHGTIRAAGGTLTLANGIADGATAGTRAQVDAGATLSLAGGASGSRADFLANNGTLALGTNTFTVDRDYTNANFGSGNAFNARAGVTGSGLIVSSGDTAQAITGAFVSGGTTASATLAFGNLRQGDSVTRTFNVANTGTAGADLRGALQTTVNGGTLSDARFTGTGATAGNFGPIATGASQAFTVTLNGTSAGAVSGQQIHLANNFDNVADQNLAFTGAIYRAAQANTITPNPINLGSTRIGGSLTSTLSIANVAGDTGGFTETLNASVTGTTGAVSASGSITGLAHNAGPSTAIGVSLSTATAGARTGTATIGFTSTEVGGSGLGTIGAGAQTVTVNGNVYQAAQAGTLAPNVNLGIVHVGDVVTRALGVSNTAPAAGGFTETLGANGVTLSPRLSIAGSASGVATGTSAANAFTVTLDTSTAQTVAGAQVRVDFRSEAAAGSGLSDLALGSQTVTYDATVNNYAALGVSFSAGMGALNFTGPNAAVLNLGVFDLTDPNASASLLFGNIATGPADTLSVTFSALGGPFTFTGFDPTAGLAAGSGFTGQVGFDPTVSGSFSQLVQVFSRSQNVSGYDGALTNFDLTVTAVVIPEPQTYALLVGGLTLLFAIVRRKF